MRVLAMAIAALLALAPAARMEGMLVYGFLESLANAYSCPLIPTGCEAREALDRRNATIPLVLVPLAFSVWASWDASQRAAGTPPR